MHVDLTGLTEQEQSTLRIWESLFEHPGWELFMQRIRPLSDNIIEMFRAAETEIALGYVRGRDDVLRGVVNLEQIVETEFNHIAQARSEPAGLAD